jgi:hypothetical protein
MVSAAAAKARKLAAAKARKLADDAGRNWRVRNRAAIKRFNARAAWRKERETVRVKKEKKEKKVEKAALGPNVQRCNFRLKKLNRRKPGAARATTGLQQCTDPAEKGAFLCMVHATAARKAGLKAVQLMSPSAQMRLLNGE